MIRAKRIYLGIVAVLLMALCQMPLVVSGATGYHKTRKVKPDTLSAVTGEIGRSARRKMSSSVHPVQIQVVGRALKVTSEYSQLLPVYTGNGSFYMVMHLNKGTNFLGGLPRGRYIINNRQITIN